ncbi:ABC transporter ATP-binding protein [Pseudemcibacter aquimaris]|uniref:ABC transporter ATP-binding protein n=1 Tax=Pseudemcibacter aquimaris TaxID=2857064 RepID=UPI0020134A5F|nr:ABC transporter ATP-binding protein [Pseudemcibacter aquimaris]MCC3861526.1 ABC transporter ATP-binding protein [Pseudemcibacter aquimaris]WDU58295.1 ABC transporter ATP-binding protein [Pseudemcibacter aquimaris]
MSQLNVQNMSLTLDGTKILNDVSLSLKTGKIVGLIGPNGAGKSMLLKSILGLIDEADGNVRIDDQDFSELHEKERAKHISYAPQGAPVHWPLMVGNLVSLGRIPHLNPWQSTSENDQKLTLDAMKKTDVAHLSTRLATSLSGGERARVMLARAIVTDSDFLFADEPIEALDPYHQIKIMQILSTLAHDGKGVLVVLHDLNFANQFCDDLILLNQGNIMASGSPDDVLTDENIKDAYHINISRAEKNGQTYLFNAGAMD